MEERRGTYEGRILKGRGECSKMNNGHCSSYVLQRSGGEGSVRPSIFRGKGVFRQETGSTEEMGAS